MQLLSLNRMSIFSNILGNGNDEKYVEFIEKSSLFHSYKKLLYFRDFDLKSDVKIIFPYTLL